MKYLTTSLLLLAVATAAPLGSVHMQGTSHHNIPPAERSPHSDADLSDHTPAAAAFKKAFRTFIGRTDQDVDKFMAKAQKTTDEFVEAAAKWKRDAQDATDEANAAFATSKRSLHLRKQMAEDDFDTFVTREYAEAEEKSKVAKKLRREAEEAATLASLAQADHLSSLKRSVDTPSPGEQHSLDLASSASKLRRDADAAADEAQEAFATVAYVLKMRAEDESIDKVVERNQNAAELATVKETRAKKELYFAEKDMRKRVAFFEKEVKLRAEFPLVGEKEGRKG